jgi:hypothetical protein
MLSARSVFNSDSECCLPNPVVYIYCEDVDFFLFFFALPSECTLCVAN